MYCGLTVISLFVLTANVIDKSSSLDNGLARTPPMGWMSWERYRCVTDCVKFPDECISDKLFRKVADLLVSEGYQSAGYEYLIIDDCWLNKTRTSDGYLQPDKDRFPNGIKAVSDYIHSKGLKFGLYEDFGTKTCGGYPGSEYYLQRDAETFASWGVDYVKLDGCYSEISQYSDAYPAMGRWLNSTGRPMVYSCSWPAYQEGAHMKPDYKLIAKNCNIWRNYNDIQDSWESLRKIIDFYGNDTTHFREIASPGAFNDPDMLIIGDFGLSYDQQRVQMALWAIMASPLIMSVDLKNIRPESKALLQNPHLIAINQDALGIQGQRVYQKNKLEVWTRPLQLKGSVAFALLNLRDDGIPTVISYKIKDLMILDNYGATYKITEAFTGTAAGTYTANDTFSVPVNPSGVYMGVLAPEQTINAPHVTIL